MSWFPNKPPVQISADDFHFKKWNEQMHRFAFGENRVIPVQTTTATAGEEFLYPADATSAGFTITLPPASTYKFKKYCAKKTDSSANIVTVAANGSDTIDGAATTTLVNQWDSVVLASDGVSQWYKIYSFGGGGGSGTTTLKGAEFTTGSGSWTVPSGVTAVWITAIGGGGGGGNTTANTPGGGGGGAGEQVTGMLQKVTSGGTVSYSVGAGGAGNADGSATTVGSFIALGGLKGVTATGSGGAGGGFNGGLGGFASIPGTNGRMGLANATFWWSGSGGGGGGSGITDNGGTGGPSGGYISGGAAGANDGTRSGGGGGASTVYGVGGAGGAGNINGSASPAATYGGGGGGAGGGTKTGGAGSAGYVLIAWVSP